MTEVKAGYLHKCGALIYYINEARTFIAVAEKAECGNT